MFPAVWMPEISLLVYVQRFGYHATTATRCSFQMLGHPRTMEHSVRKARATLTPTARQTQPSATPRAIGECGLS